MLTLLRTAYVRVLDPITSLRLQTYLTLQNRLHSWWRSYHIQRPCFDHLLRIPVGNASFFYSMYDYWAPLSLSLFCYINRAENVGITYKKVTGVT